MRIIRRCPWSGHVCGCDRRDFPWKIDDKTLQPECHERKHGDQSFYGQIDLIVINCIDHLDALKIYKKDKKNFSKEAIAAAQEIITWLKNQDASHSTQ